MTNHLEWHQHAFIDENNIVKLVAVFDEWAHNHQLLDDICAQNGTTKAICCCQYGLADIGDSWDDVNKQWIYNRILPPPLDEIAEEFQV